VDNPSGYHVIWDWNGTLLADLSAVVLATNASLIGFTERRFTEESYRALFSRPVRQFHETFIGCALSDDDWDRIDDAYHDSYLQAVGSIPLAQHALHALDEIASAGWTQSILSLSPHEQLVHEVGLRLGEVRFLAVSGRRIGDTEGKTSALERHLSALSTPRSRVWLVGDTEDDAKAATIAEIQFVLVQENSFEASVHSSTYTPATIAHDLKSAVRAMRFKGRDQEARAKERS
jgi:phosphoglycolate phosphatase-like HAD superfamily hydrolase